VHASGRGWRPWRHVRTTDNRAIAKISPLCCQCEATGSDLVQHEPRELKRFGTLAVLAVTLTSRELFAGRFAALGPPNPGSTLRHGACRPGGAAVCTVASDPDKETSPFFLQALAYSPVHVRKLSAHAVQFAYALWAVGSLRWVAVGHAIGARGVKEE